MICPSCGAEMEQRAFMHVCSFCGSIAVTEGRTLPAFSNGQKNEQLFYEYIQQNLSAIRRSSFVDIKDSGEVFECVSAKPFFPNDGHYTIYKDLSFWCYAKIAKREISMALLVNTQHNAAHNFICIKVGRIVLTLKQAGELSGKKMFPLSFADFDFLCSANVFHIDTNMSVSAFPLDYTEFATYIRRFFHIVIDKTKYLYSINEKLLTD